MYGVLELLSAYVASAIGVFVGLEKYGRPSDRDFISVLFLAGVVTLVVLMLLSLSHGPTELPSSLVGRVAVDLLVLPLMFGGGVLAARWRSARAKPPEPQHKRGALLQDHSATQIAKAAGGAELTFAGVPVPAMDETKHFKLLGTTGTGKSTVIRELLTGALGRGDRAIITDPNGSYLKHFGGAGRTHQILNPFDPNASRWDLFAEITELHDADQLARSLIPDERGPDQNWRLYARTFLTAVLRQLHRANERDITKLFYLLSIAPAAELRDLLEATPAGPFLGQDNGRFFESVRAVANTHLAGLEHVARQTRGEALSVRKWTREGAGVLYLPYRASEIASLRSLISTWMRLAIFEAMNGEETDQRLWFIIDELDALGAIDGLKDASVRVRKFGGRCVLGLQSIAQPRATYGDADAQTIVENCGNSLILRCSGSEGGGTSEFASRLIGRREIIRQQRSWSRSTGWSGGAGGTRTVSEQHVVEDAVMPSEIEQLADFSGFLKIASTPEWWRITVSRR